jgi:hypothetical protein
MLYSLRSFWMSLAACSPLLLVRMDNYAFCLVECSSKSGSRDVQFNQMKQDESCSFIVRNLRLHGSSHKSTQRGSLATSASSDILDPIGAPPSTRTHLLALCPVSAPHNNQDPWSARSSYFVSPRFRAVSDELTESYSLRRRCAVSGDAFQKVLKFPPTSAKHGL